MPFKQTIREVFLAFLVLGLTSFGGPVAHLSYFRHEFVERRQWLSEQAYADIVALCQTLPGPASSQVGFALGYMRAGFGGAAAAWLAFTLPSAVLLILFAFGASWFEGPLGQGLLQGLKITAVAIVAHAVWGMARSLCPDAQRTGIALAAVLVVTVVGSSWSQLAVIGMGGGAGWVFYRQQRPPTGAVAFIRLSPRVGQFAAFLLVALLLGLPLGAWWLENPTLQLADAFYRAGAWVFGGGHVVLPLLEVALVPPGWVSAEVFLSGYGAAQAVPGPLFTFAAYLGMVINGGGVGTALLALVMIFLPGLLLLIAVLPHWQRWRQSRLAPPMLLGANAAVVGILGAALYNPVWTNAILRPLDFVLALSGFLMLSVWQLPAWVVVITLATGGMLLAA